ncbi:MAG: DUF4197 domain-containing protein [Paludibacter sp.]|nr:DUF4197 domain-containing protein [Paludibacter sp.]
MKTVFFSLIALSITLSSCDVLMQIASGLPAVSQSTGIPTTYTNTSGLKEALQVGLTNSVSLLHQQDAFYTNAAMKILLPAEAQTIVENIKLIPGGNTLVDDVVLRINRAAEDAVVEAKPIFTSAILNMSFTDATSILFGGNQAATEYLRKATYDQLFAAFKPRMQISLEKDLIGGISTQESWSTLTYTWNNVAKSTVGQITGLQAVNTDLSAYATQRALEGLFLQVGLEEQKIRKDPQARVTNLLKQVFGQLDR